MQVTRRQFCKICAAGLGGSSLGMMGYSPGEVLAQTHAFKLTRATETRSTCPYCAVSCGLLIYSMGDKAKNARSEIIHIEGDPDNPVNRGTLCPKGAGLLDMIQSPDRLNYPEVRESGSKEWKRISWDEAFTRIAGHMKVDRDTNFVTENSAGLKVNRWPTFGFLASSSSINEVGYISHKVLRGLGVVTIDTQARI
jgi:formate dehydrogenase major subunit